MRHLVISQYWCMCGLVHGCMGWCTGMTLQPASTVHTFSFTLHTPTPLTPPLSNATSLFPYHNLFSHACHCLLLGPPGLSSIVRSDRVTQQHHHLSWCIGPGLGMGAGVGMGAGTGTCARMGAGMGTGRAWVWERVCARVRVREQERVCAWMQEWVARAMGIE
jgi:hypothetical protein